MSTGMRKEAMDDTYEDQSDNEEAEDELESRSVRRSSRRSSSREHSPGRAPLGLLGIVGAILVTLIYVYGFFHYGLVDDDIHRGVAWFACALLGSWGCLFYTLNKRKTTFRNPVEYIVLLLFFMIIWSGLQLLPLPSGLILTLSPIWSDIKASYDASGIDFPSHITLATSPEQGLRSWHQLVAATAFFLGALALASRKGGARTLVALVVVGGLLEGLIGFLKFALGGEERTYGVIYNPNHHAAFIAMSLMLSIGVLYSIRGSEWARLGTHRSDQVVAMSGVFLVGAIGWFVSFSRGSILTTAMVVIVWVMIEVWHEWKEAMESRSTQATISGLLREVPKDKLVIALGVFIFLVAFSFMHGGLSERIERGRSDSFLSFGGRTELSVATLKGLPETYFLGVGLRGAEFSINRHLSENVTGRKIAVWTHSDWAQIVSELGLPFIIGSGIILFFMIRSSRDWWELKTKRSSWQDRLLMRASLAGILVGLIHALGEFHLRIPLVSFQFLILVALFFGRGTRWVMGDQLSSRRRRVFSLDRRQ